MDGLSDKFNIFLLEHFPPDATRGMSREYVLPYLHTQL